MGSVLLIVGVGLSMTWSQRNLLHGSGSGLASGQAPIGLSLIHI